MIPPYLYRNRTFQVVICRDGGPCVDPDCDARHEVIDVVPKVAFDLIASGSRRQSDEIRRLEDAQRGLINENSRLKAAARAAA